MDAKDAARIAKPTIAEVLKQFLEDQRGRLAAKTFANYEYAIELLEHCLNGYGYQTLGRADAQLFDRLYTRGGAEHREFCEIFGPEHIGPNLGEFLGYFMPRKVIAGKETFRAAGTVTKKLAKWLHEKGYIEAEDAEDAADRGAEAARDLPKAQEVIALLQEFAEEEGPGRVHDKIEDHFTLTRVEPGKVWVQGMLDKRDLGPMQVPEEISRRCQVGWSVSGVVGRVGKTWRIVEAWNVYPG